MRQIVEDLRTQISDFVDSRDNVALVVGMKDTDAPLVYKMIESIDESNGSAVFWPVIEAFATPAEYVEACVEGFKGKFEEVRDAIKDEGLEPWPDIPKEIVDPEHLDPIPRMRRLIIFSREIIHYTDGLVVVWPLIPFELKSIRKHEGFMAALWEHEMPFPWCHHIRLILRGSSQDCPLVCRAEESERVMALKADFSPPAIRAAIEKEADNDSAPLSDRISSINMMAGMDFSNGDYDQAEENYRLVNEYAKSSEDWVLAASALNGLGETEHARGKSDAAGEYFQEALAPAAEAAEPPVPLLFNINKNLAGVRDQQERWDESEQFYNYAADYAYILRDPDARLACWRKRAAALNELEKENEYLKVCKNGAILAGKLDNEERYQEFLVLIRDALSEDSEELKKTYQEIEEKIDQVDEEPQPAEQSDKELAPKKEVIS